MVISWGVWLDDLSGIDRYEYYVYHSDGTGNVTDGAVPLYQGNWTDTQSSPTYIPEHVREAFTVVVNILDRAGNKVTLKKGRKSNKPVK